ncbi:YdcF family protein [uncultured Serinicoccus sp.]|uniref:YdcF family protein n=1 Tax=uncultured Serinicoccus sp. TaxID=735514 RepID=UPI002632F26E|nr:YdcF family protein [uncultured Serinicoccus sp.]
MVGLGAGLLLLAAWPGFVLLVLLVARWRLCRPGTASGCGAVVVLGAPVPDGEVGEELAARLRGGLAARAALAAGSGHSEGAGGQDGGLDEDAPALPLVLTGGRGTRGRPAEAVAMGRWVQAVDPRAPVVLEDRATTTVENLRLSAALLGARGAPPPYAVVTSAYHAPRTRWLVRRNRLPLRVVGVRVPTDPAAAYLRELLIVLKQAGWAQAVAAVVVLGGALLAGLAAR